MLSGSNMFTPKYLSVLVKDFRRLARQNYNLVMLLNHCKEEHPPPPQKYRKVKNVERMMLSLINEGLILNWYKSA